VRPTLLETVTRFLFCHRNPLFHRLFVRRLLLRFYDYADIDFDIHRQTAAAALSLRVKSIVMTRPNGLLTSTSSAYLSVRLLLRENVTFMFSMLHLADLCPRHLCLFASSAECPGQKSDSPECVTRKEARLSLNSTDRRVTSTFTIVFPLRCGTINVRLLPIDCSAHRSDDRFVPSNQPLCVPEVYPTCDQCNHRIHVRIQLSPYIHVRVQLSHLPLQLLGAQISNIRRMTQSSLLLRDLRVRTPLNRRERVTFKANIKFVRQSLTIRVTNCETRNREWKAAEKRKHDKMLPSTIRVIICNLSNCDKTNSS